MTKLILATRPNHDRQTEYLHAVCGDLIKEIEAVGEYRVIDLDGPKAVRKQFTTALKKANPRLIVLNGHGTSNSVYGHGNDEIILDANNIKYLDSKIIFANTCDSSLELGEFAVNDGKAEAFIGYDAYFMIVTDPSRSTTPNKNKRHYS